MKCKICEFEIDEDPEAGAGEQCSVCGAALESVLSEAEDEQS